LASFVQHIVDDRAVHVSAVDVKLDELEALAEERNACTSADVLGLALRELRHDTHEFHLRTSWRVPDHNGVALSIPCVQGIDVTQNST
jgi:hypothetical protein